MNILIIGSSGILGHSLYNKLKKKHNVSHTGLKKRLWDLTIKKNLNKILNRKIDVVINCCAITNIDFAENNKKFTNEINFKLVKNILEINKKRPFYFINFSSDQVYNNKDYKKNKEDQISFDGNYYTKTKIKVDKLNNDLNFLNLRINFFGKSFRGKGTFTDWLFIKIKKNEKILLFKDQYISGLSLKTLTNIISKIIYKKKFGLFNLGSKGNISKKNLALYFYQSMKIKKKLITNQ